jgi:hypothetical protein
VGEAGTGRVPTVVGVDGCVDGCQVVSEMATQPIQGLAWAQLGVRGSCVADLFATDGVLLVVEGHSSTSDTMGQVIQRVIHSKVAVGSDEEGDVLEAEGLRRPGTQLGGGARTN